MIASFTAEEILHEALVAPRDALVPLPDTQIVQRPGWYQLVTPSLTRGGMNEVTCTELPDGDAGEALIDETIATYRRQGLRFRWTVPPGVTPADLADRLARRGLHRSESLAMARSTGDLPAKEYGLITVEEVDLSNVDDFTHVMAEGWQSDPAPLDVLNRRQLTDPANRNCFFLARHAGVPAAVATHVVLERSVYMMGGVVLPAHRGRGLYRALVYARLRHAATRGLLLATTLARADTSAPILRNLGFETVCALPTFTSD